MLQLNANGDVPDETVVVIVPFALPQVVEVDPNERVGGGALVTETFNIAVHEFASLTVTV